MNRSRIAPTLVALALAVGFAAPGYAQIDASKTGAGPRGTAVGPSTVPSQSGTGTSSPTGTTASRPATHPASQTSLSDGKAPPAGAHQVTGASDQSSGVKAMNNAAKAKVEQEGK